jgi:hypothetical protein
MYIVPESPILIPTENALAGHSYIHTYTTIHSHLPSSSSLHISHTSPGALCSDICNDDVIPRVARSLGAPAPLPARLHTQP